MSQPLIEVKHLSKHFPYKKGILKAVHNVSLDIYPGKTLALIGESGCGKSTLGKLLLRLEEKTAGSVLFSGIDIFTLPPKELKAWRQKAQPIFQDPYASLNPRMTAETILKEPFDIHHIPVSPQRLDELFLQVSLDPSCRTKFPHEFSSGQRQRLSIARALALYPQFLVCDEPLASLDISTQIQIVDLLKTLQKKLGLSYLFISHDLRMVKQLADKVAVMQAGQIVEIAETQKLYENPEHPYTQSLLAAIPFSAYSSLSK